MGVVTGITMSFQFGTNWPGYMNTVGNIAGPLLAYEVLTAFFLEATFLGVMLFGMDRVPGWVHVGLVGDRGLRHHRVGVLDPRAQLVDADARRPRARAGRAHRGELARGDLQSLVPVPPHAYAARLGHHRVVRRRGALGVAAAQGAAGCARRCKTLRFGAHLAAVLVPIQVVVGDLHGLNTLEHQPAKIAAMEALWKTERGAPLTLIGFPNEQERRNDFAITVPKVLSLILVHDPNGEVKGLEEFEDTPPVAPVFWAFRVMVGTGVLMLLISWTGSFVLRKQAAPRWLLWAFAGLHVLGLGRDARRLARHRDRPPAVARDRPALHRGRRG